MLDTIFSSLLTGLIGLVIGQRLRIGSDAFERRRQFRTQLDILLAKLRDTRDESIINFHSETFMAIRDDCAKIRSDIFFLRPNRLDDAAHQYYCLQQTESREEVQQSGAVKIKSSKVDFPGRKRIQTLLVQMRDYAR